jgi:hypothetical protein
VRSVDSGRRRPSAACCSAHPASGPAPHDQPDRNGNSCNSTHPLARGRACSEASNTVGASRWTGTSFGDACRAPAACWCALITVASTASHHSPATCSSAPAQLIQDLLPSTVGRPTLMPVVHRLPIPIRTRQIPPRRPGPHPPQHPVDHGAMIGPPPSPPARHPRQQRLQPSPVLIAQIVSIMHEPGLQHPGRFNYGDLVSR